MVVPRYKLSLSHTPIKHLLGFPGIDVFACGLRDHVITRFASFGIRAWFRPLVVRFQILVHLGTTRINGKHGFMCFSQNHPFNHFIIGCMSGYAFIYFFLVS